MNIIYFTFIYYEFFIYYVVFFYLYVWKLQSILHSFLIEIVLH